MKSVVFGGGPLRVCFWRLATDFLVLRHWAAVVEALVRNDGFGVDGFQLVVVMVLAVSTHWLRRYGATPVLSTAYFVGGLGMGAASGRRAGSIDRRLTGRGTGLWAGWWARAPKTKIVLRLDGKLARK